MPIFAELLTVAKKVDNYEIYTGAGDTYWVDTTHYRATCPAGKRWVLLGGMFSRDVSGTATTYVYNVGDELIAQLGYEAAATGRAGYPEWAQAKGTMWMFDAGDYVEIIFGAAQSTAAFASCVVLEIDV